MLGHGNRPADDFHMPTFAQDLYSTYFANGLTYDVIIGHSLGATVTLALLPLLSAPAQGQKTAVILVDPGIYFSDKVLDDFAAEFGKNIGRPKSVEAYMSEHPTWNRLDAVSRVVALHTAQSELPRRVFEVSLCAYRVVAIRF
jgi:pimeloyl-ACP methyl ester carboxylesterase